MKQMKQYTATVPIHSTFLIYRVYGGSVAKPGMEQSSSSKKTELLQSASFPPWLRKNHQKDFTKSVDEPPGNIPVD